ncbi:hypothetical protein MP638_002154 [Amoeboaphelidium occidentale]|nr:hypothetical protein MP638_002154 [Amoeboaphelidium occidentale]
MAASKNASIQSPEQTEAHLPVGVCVKVSSLRPKYSDLKQWCAVPGHLLATRHGLDKSLKLFEKYLSEKLSVDAATRERFMKLSACKELGCFCNPAEKCHRDIIIRKLYELIQS